MSLRPGLLWLTLHLALIFHSLSRNKTFYFFNLAHTVRGARGTTGFVKSQETEKSKAL
jgi:hypothetical protein